MKTIIVLLLLAALVGAGVWIELAKRHQRLAAEAEQAHAEAIAALRAEMEEFAAEASRARQTAERAAGNGRHRPFPGGGAARTAAVAPRAGAEGARRALSHRASA
jgi:hypothetical protein